jgi:divinyl protochlorophyllide a 8-vinyl-reductase
MTAGRGAARIGPNAISQVARALQGALGPESTRELMGRAGLGAYADDPPSRMVDEDEVIALHSAVRSRLAPKAARGVARAAGLATGDYLLAHRIPRFAQGLLRALPAALASRILVAAIARHAWTFAGSGHFEAHGARPVAISIGACPICRGALAAQPLCDYYAATFTRLFSRLVHPRARARETECMAAGAPACRFLIDW